MKEDMEIRHIVDLAKRSYNSNRYTFTNFLTPAQQGDFFDIVAELPPCGYYISGGYEGAERAMIRFGNEEMLGYDEELPLVYVCIEPVAAKFADELSHRDVLGSIMNLGMERDRLGDILIKDNKVWVICLESIAAVIMNELCKIRHTTVKCSISESVPEDLKPRLEDIKIQVMQERIDAVVAKMYNLSRNASSLLFVEGKVAVNGREQKNHSYMLKEDEIISVRGYGKFKYVKKEGTNKKGKTNLLLQKYV